MNIFVPDLELSPSFYKAFKDQFAEAPTILSANAYDATILFTRIFRSCAGDSKCLKAKIESTKNFVGVSGTFAFESDRSVTRAFQHKVLKNGRFSPA